MSRAHPRHATGRVSDQPPLPARALQINNMVFLGRLDQRIDNVLSALALRGSYDPATFTAWTVRPLVALATLSVFSNGKVIIAGARSELDARVAMEQLAYALSKQFDTLINALDIVVHNVVGSARVGFEVDLKRMHKENKDYCRWHRGNFPGLQYSWYNDMRRRQESRVSDRSQNIAVVVFSTGSMVLTGARRQASDLQHVFDEIKDFIARYRVVPTTD